jgi:guanine deaminase
MQWLTEYTFPEESRFSSPEYAHEVYSHLVRRLLRNGTTTALYFGSSHLEATKILARICGEMGQRAFVGKNCSDGELCPEYYRETTEGSIRDTRAFVEWCQAGFGREGRVRAVVTPRFVGAPPQPSFFHLPLKTSCTRNDHR